MLHIRHNNNVPQAMHSNAQIQLCSSFDLNFCLFSSITVHPSVQNWYCDDPLQLCEKSLLRLDEWDIRYWAGGDAGVMRMLEVIWDDVGAGCSVYDYWLLQRFVETGSLDHSVASPSSIPGSGRSGVTLCIIIHYLTQSLQSWLGWQWLGRKQ